MLTSAQKYKIVQETEAMNEEELAQYCLNNNLRESQIRKWIENCKNANAGIDYRLKYELEHEQTKIELEKSQELQKKIQELNEDMKAQAKELERMQEALAELALRDSTLKKFQAIFAQKKKDQ